MSAQSPLSGPSLSEEATLQQLLDGDAEEVPRPDLIDPAAADVGARLQVDSRSGGVPQNGPTGATPRQAEPSRPSTRVPTPEEDETDVELEELLIWQKKTQRQERLKKLKDVRARYKAGDVSALYEDVGSVLPPIATTLWLSVPLPCPKDP